jgi:hypothetical protein
MAEEARQQETLSPEIQEAMRSMVAAIRAVKIYPRNNPVYEQSVKKSFLALERCLQGGDPYPMGVQKTYFLYDQVPVGKDTQMNKAVAQDLFAKGIRQIVFFSGITEDELFSLLRALALSSEEMAMRSGIVSILWEKGATHIHVTEAELDEVIVTHADDAAIQKTLAEAPHISLPPEEAAKEFVLSDRTLVLGDIVGDPKSFGASMIELAQQTVGEGETVEDRLHALYREAGKKIEEQHPDQSEALFQGLAQSVLEMEPHYRDNLINAKLYADLDADSAQGVRDEMQAEVPHHLHEIMTGRFNKEWTVQQVAILLKKSAELKSPTQPAVHPSQVVPEPIPADIEAIAHELSEYTAAEMEDLRIIGESGMESDILEATVRTLLFLLPLAQNPHRNASPVKDAELFNGIVHQLENVLGYLLSLKDYRLARIIMRTLRDIPAPPEYLPRLREAYQKASSRENIVMFLGEMRANPKSSERYQEAYALLELFAEEATPVLLEFLASEQDRTMRFFLLELIKDLGKGQLAVIATGLTDRRWFVVRNVVIILAETGTEQALPFLEKVQDHKNEHIREEVIKALVSIGGKRAAGMLCRYLKDRDLDIQMLALRSLGVIRGAGTDEAQRMMEYLEHRRISKNRDDNEFITEGIRMLGRIGKQDSIVFLERYERIRWWKARQPQEAVRVVARAAIEEISRRLGHDGGKG